ncbi:MAG: DUF86 domain-containing protein [Candidatus Sericytochromatia bacterium]|nr:DUF86 domain-containing protein [Candidatus Sericytochromatia bacterium]
MTHRWTAHARHILDAIAKIRRIEARGDITQDDILYDAALRNLQTLSESTQRLPEDLKALAEEIPWRAISGFRNIPVHNYLGNIDPITVHKVIQEHLHPLEKRLTEWLKNSDEQG